MGFAMRARGLLGGFKRNRSQPMAKAVATGSMLLNVVLILIVITLAVVAYVFIKGGLESVMETWRSFT